MTVANPACTIAIRAPVEIVHFLLNIQDTDCGDTCWEAIEHHLRLPCLEVAIRAPTPLFQDTIDGGLIALLHSHTESSLTIADFAK
jgi:hypothetical protein